MAFRFYRHFTRQLLAGSWQGTAALSDGAPAAAPTINVTGVSSGYVFDYTHTVEADFSAYATELVYSLDGEDATQALYNDGVLWLEDGGPGELSSPTGTTAGLVLWVDHGSWVQLVGFWDDAIDAPFAPVDTDSPTVEWPRLDHYVFETFPWRGIGLDESMMYPGVIESALGALLGGSTRTDLVPSGELRFDLVGADAYMVWSHRHITDIPSDWWAIGPGVGDPQTVTWGARSTDYVSDGARFLISGELAFVAPSGQDAYALVGWDATSGLLIGFCPIGLVPLYGEDVTLPFTQDTGVIQLGSDE